MNLILRLLRVVLHAFFRAQVDLLETAKLSFRVWPHDLDINLHMTNSRYLSMMDLGRMDLLIRSGLAAKIYRRRWLPVLGSATIRWRKALNIFDPITLETRTLGWDDKWIYIEQRIISKDIVYAIAIVKGLFVGKDGPIPIQQVTNLIKAGVKSPAIPPIIKLWVEMEEEMRNRLNEES